MSKRESFANHVIAKKIHDDDEVDVELPESGVYYWYVKARKAGKVYNSVIRKLVFEYDDN